MKKLHFIILGAGPVSNSEQPFGIQQITFEKSVLDWQLHAFGDNIHDITFVGGYEIDRVIKKYPDFIYVYNHVWMDSGPCLSLKNAFDQLPHLTNTSNDICIL